MGAQWICAEWGDYGPVSEDSFRAGWGTRVEAGAPQPGWPMDLRSLLHLRWFLFQLDPGEGLRGKGYPPFLSAGFGADAPGSRLFGRWRPCKSLTLAKGGTRGAVGLSIWSPGTRVWPQAGTPPDRLPVQIPRSLQPQHQGPCCPQDLCVFLRGCRVTGPAPPRECWTPGQDRTSVGLTWQERAGCPSQVSGVSVNSGLWAPGIPNCGAVREVG